MKFLSLPLALLLLSMPAHAFGPEPEGEVTAQAICSNLINRSSVTIQGSFETAKQTLADGTRASHVSNFKLSPNEEKKICAAGPFYEGRRINLTIRTLFPLFSCKTRIDQDIFLDMKEIAYGQKEYSATCR